MDQVHTPQPPQTPPTPAPQQLPHLVVDEPKRSPWAIGGIAVLALMVLAIPLGLFLVQQRTNIAPQAAVSEPPPAPQTGILLESKLSLESEGGVIPVDVYVKSADALNLADVKLNFNSDSLEVERIATDSASIKETGGFSKWLQSSFDNSAGTVSIIAGVPSPGVKTADLKDGKGYLATLYLRPKTSGSTMVQAAPESRLLRNSDSQNVFQTGSDLVLNLSAASQSSTSPAPSPTPNPNAPVLVITSPAPADNYSYFKPIDIVWSSFNTQIISQLNLYVNGEFFGPIAQNLESNSGTFTWNPQETLSLPYIQSGNTYSIEILGIGRTGLTGTYKTGPFGITGQEEPVGSAPNPELFLANQLSIDDASRLLSNYLVLPLGDSSLDFNKDEVINELDFYLIKKNLLSRGIIK